LSTVFASTNFKFQLKYSKASDYKNIRFLIDYDPKAIVIQTKTMFIKATTCFIQTSYNAAQTVNIDVCVKHSFATDVRSVVWKWKNGKMKGVGEG